MVQDIYRTQCTVLKSCVSRTANGVKEGVVMYYSISLSVLLVLKTYIEIHLFLFNIIYIIWHNIPLTQQHLLVMCEICSEFFIFQRNNLSAR